MSDHPVIILGAGLAGLSTAHHLGGGYRIFEKERQPGGVARTFERNGYLFDMTGHWLHLRDGEVRALVEKLLPGQLQSIERRAAIVSHGVRTPYPFQAHTFGLPSEVVAQCLLGFFRAREQQAAGQAAPPRNFEEFIRARLGDGIAEHFMLPYNRKLWTVPASELSYHWCDRFVPLPQPEQVVYGALTAEGSSHGIGYNAEFLYPQQGGIGQLAEHLAAGLPRAVETASEATGVDWQQRTVTLADGQTLPYRRLVSTLPLKTLVARLTQPPDAIRQAAEKLRAASVTYWDIGVRGAQPADAPHWIYFPEEQPPFYRVGAPSAVSSHLAPNGCHSFYVETSHPQGSPPPHTTDAILAGLRAVGLLGENVQPEVVHRATLDGAYVIMDHAYGDARREILDWLADQGIFSIGRYGAWTYDSMEGAIIQGRDAANQLREQLRG